MEFGTYAGRAVLTAVDLVNSEDADAAALAGLLASRGWEVGGDIGDGQLPRFRALRGRLRTAFGAGSTRDVVDMLNALLADQRALPQLTDHDGGWHWHYLPRGSSLADRVATACAAALLGVIVRDGDAARLRTCTADGCRNVFVDASRNGKRRFCDDRTCGNRTHAAAYRARQSKPSSAQDRPDAPNADRPAGSAYLARQSKPSSAQDRPDTPDTDRPAETSETAAAKRRQPRAG